MALPLLLIGAAALAGGYGVKKGIDAKRDFNRAESLNDEARDVYDNACSELELARNQTQMKVDALGKLKFELYKNRLIPFVEAFSKIKNVDFRDQKLTEEFKLSGITKSDLLAIEKSALQMKDVVGGGITALGAGGLAGLATYGGVGLLGTATTGTAISTLSGAAATNATLAWLGGGALGTGFGMAGGAAVLGGIVAGPVLAIGGMMLASKAAEAKENAYANLDKARVAAEEMETARVATCGIQKRFEEIAHVLHQLDKHFIPLLSGLQRIIKQSTDYGDYSTENRKGIMMTVALAKTIKNVMEAPLLDGDGGLTLESRKVLDAANQQLLDIAKA